MLTGHPHLQGLVLGFTMLAIAAAGTPAAVDAARDLARMPEAANVQSPPVEPDAATAASTSTSTSTSTPKIVTSPVIAAKVG